MTTPDQKAWFKPLNLFYIPRVGKGNGSSAAGKWKVFIRVFKERPGNL
jgi:hypothetical protein